MDEKLPRHESEPITPSQEIAGMLEVMYGEDHGFDAETLSEIAGLPFTEAFEAAYGYLTQAGLEADEVLTPWIEQPEQE